jgi:hypothetical protein
MVQHSGEVLIQDTLSSTCSCVHPYFVGSGYNNGVQQGASEASPPACNLYLYTQVFEFPSGGGGYHWVGGD